MIAPKIYSSFEEFAREELKVHERLDATVDDMLDEMFAEELNFDPGDSSRSRRREEAEEDEEIF